MPVRVPVGAFLLASAILAQCLVRSVIPACMAAAVCYRPAGLLSLLLTLLLADCVPLPGLVGG
jgi:hypothetical protein|eukprot:COSAG06_NODE_1116_length_10641_cov_138.587270_6_plen_63_part_00